MADGEKRVREIAPPFYFVWTEEGVFKPLTPYIGRMCDQHFTVHDQYRMVEQPERSRKSHNEFFATIKDMWASMPEHLEAEFPSPDHFRKYLLCRTGFCDKASYVAGTNAQAVALAAFLKPLDEYAIITISGKVVTMYRAHSQAFDAMAGPDFQKAKTAIYDMASIVLATPAPKKKRERRV